MFGNLFQFMHTKISDTKKLVRNSVYVGKFHSRHKKAGFFLVVVAIPKCHVYTHSLGLLFWPRKKKKFPNLLTGAVRQINMQHSRSDMSKGDGGEKLIVKWILI